MDTPEPARRASASSPSVQDSPFVNYANSLSPIKLVNAGTSVHGDITVPSPQPVFTSPHINLPRKLDLVRRSHRPSVSGSEYFTSRLPDDSTPYMEAAEISGPSASLPMFQLTPCTQVCHNDDPSEDHSSGSHSSCVDEFLVDPVGDINSPASPSQSPKQAAELPRSTQGDDCGANDKTNETHKVNHREGPRCTSLAFVKESMGNPEGSTSTVVCDADVNKPTELTQGLQSDSRMLKEVTLNLNITKYEQETGSAACMNLNSSFQAEDGQNRQGPSAPLNLVDSEGCLKVFDNSMRTSDSSVKNKLELERDCIHDGTDTDFPSVQPSGKQDEQLSEHHIALDHPSITSTDSDIVDHRKGNSASSFACHISNDAKQQLFQNEKPQESNSTPQLQIEPMQKVIKAKNPLEDAGAKCSRSSDDLDPDEHEEGSQQLRGMRKRLQFEAVETHSLSSGRGKASSTFTSISDAHPPEVPSEDFESINFTYAESVATSNNMQETRIVNHPGKALCRLSQCSDKTPEAHAGEVGRAVPVNESPFAAVHRSSGIGLHLNSVGSIGPMNCNSNIQLPGRTMIIRGKKSLHGNKAPLDPHFHSTSANLKVGRSVKLIACSQDPMLCAATEDGDNNLLENQPMKESNPSVKFESLLDVKPIRSINHLNLTDCYTSPCDTKKMSENSSMSEESTQTSPQKKRKKGSDSDSSKRCNCKRSKCLKLYCDCFAAGAFCTEDCSCKDCFNRPEHQDVVVGTRQQIESRNPLAFAPKVVIRVNDSQKESGESKTITPTAARHKRGCNCKKSLCLKKYCECYQAGVGCSFGCRCEGCQNSFGRKDGFGDINELERKILQKETEYKNSMAGEWERPSSGEKLENKGVRIQTINAKLHHSRLSPLTPLLQGSSEDVGFKPQFPSSYYPSPESSASVLPSFTESPSSLGFPVSSSTSTEAREGSLSLVPYDHEPDCHAAFQVDSFSPGWDGFPDICNLSPLPNTSPVASIATSSQTREHKVLQTKLFQGSGRLSGGTLRWRSSPITPLPHFHANKFVTEAKSGSGQHSIIEDDTPDILKEAQQPIKETKATSPNQKRVSPPHKFSNEPCSTISPGIKSGRKFILQSVPSFPPLTPYSNSTRQQDRQN